MPAKKLPNIDSMSQDELRNFYATYRRQGTEEEYMKLAMDVVGDISSADDVLEQATEYAIHKSALLTCRHEHNYNGEQRAYDKCYQIYGKLPKEVCWHDANTPNLDSMSLDELQKLNVHSLLGLIGEGRIGRGFVASKLMDYVVVKMYAIGHRSHGLTDAAMKCEVRCDGIYKELPNDVKW